MLKPNSIISHSDCCFKLECNFLKKKKSFLQTKVKMILRDNFLDNCEYFGRAVIRISTKRLPPAWCGNITCLNSTIKETLIVRLQTQGRNVVPLTSLTVQPCQNSQYLDFKSKVTNSTCSKMTCPNLYFF